MSVRRFRILVRRGAKIASVAYVLVEGGRGHPDASHIAPEEVVDEHLTFPVSLSHPNGAVISPDELLVEVSIQGFAQLDEAGSLVQQILPRAGRLYGPRPIRKLQRDDHARALARSRIRPSRPPLISLMTCGGARRRPPPGPAFGLKPEPEAGNRADRRPDFGRRAQSL